MNEDQIKELGFELVDKYDHDQFHTNRYKKGCLQIEFTYIKKELVNYDLTISEFCCEKILLKNIKLLTEILENEQ